MGSGRGCLWRKRRRTNEGNMGFFKNLFGAPKADPNLPGGDGWTARMGWRNVSYLEGRQMLTLQIEPMASGPDTVYVPDAQAWLQSAPSWARSRGGEILLRLKSIAWNRELIWEESPQSEFLTDDAPLPGSLETTPGGQKIEGDRLFHPTSRMSHEQAHHIWHVLARRFAEAAQGRVTLYASTVIPNSVFEVIELPALRANPNVTLEFK